MIRLTLIAALALIALVMFGCEKEKIIESTEYIQETEYIEIPGDTVYKTDTVTVGGSGVDTVTITMIDTVMIGGTDTITIYNTDTVTLVDTVNTGSAAVPSASLAFAALIPYSNSLVLEFINAEYGIADGWIFYLNEHQSDVTVISDNVYDIYGLIDFWTVDWSAFEPLEFFWRMTYTGGDPMDPANWDISDPPSAAPYNPGIHPVSRPAITAPLNR